MAKAPGSLYKRAVLKRCLHALAIAALAATAVDFGFSVGFIKDPVAYATALYTTGLIVALVPPPGLAAASLVWRLPVALASAALTLLSLRTWALLPLQIGHGTTTGHSPYVVLPSCALLAVVVIECISRLRRPLPVVSAKE